MKILKIDMTLASESMGWVVCIRGYDTSNQIRVNLCVCSQRFIDTDQDAANVIRAFYKLRSKWNALQKAHAVAPEPRSGNPDAD